MASLEFERLALVVAADKKAAAATYGGPAYYQAQAYLLELLDIFGLTGWVRFEPLEASDTDSATVYYEPGRAATIYIDDTILGRIGEYKVSVRDSLKLPDSCAGFELGLRPILEMQQAKSYVALPRFPKVSQDITLSVPTSLHYKELFDFVRTNLDTTKPDNSRLTLGPIDIYQDEERR